MSIENINIALPSSLFILLISYVATNSKIKRKETDNLYANGLIIGLSSGLVVGLLVSDVLNRRIKKKSDRDNLSRGFYHGILILIFIFIFTILISVKN